MAAGGSARADDGRVLRADARRNRALVLDAAIAAFAEAGLTVPVHEIARRAGVGTGTVSRHFPTKDDLFEAIVLERVDRLVSLARELADTLEPGPAFFGFLAAYVREGALNLGLSQALAGVGYDMEAAALRAGLDYSGALRDLLTAAQADGSVSGDVEPADVKALMAGCLARPDADESARERMIRIVCDGLRAIAPTELSGAGTDMAK
jgi:AcrR family transcriptional regulator